MKIMEIYKNYRMKPVKKIISNEIKYADGIPEDILQLAIGLGLLSENEFEVAKGIKEKKPISLTEKQIFSAIEDLLRKKIITEQENS